METYTDEEDVAADLRPGDRVQVGDTARIVWQTEWTGRAVDSDGTQGLLIYWVGTSHGPSIVRATKDFTILNPNPKETA